jgi:hypothetical protein
MPTLLKALESLVRERGGGNKQDVVLQDEDEPPLISTTFGTTSPFAAEATE